MSAQPCITSGGTISTSPTFNSTLREPTAKPPQPGPFGPPSGLAVPCRPLTTWPSLNAVPRWSERWPKVGQMAAEQFPLRTGRSELGEGFLGQRLFLRFGIFQREARDAD